MLKQKKGQASECVTHVCHASRHVPIYRGISRFLLWRWGGELQSRTPGDLRACAEKCQFGGLPPFYPRFHTSHISRIARPLCCACTHFAPKREGRTRWAGSLSERSTSEVPHQSRDTARASTILPTPARAARPASQRPTHSRRSAKRRSGSPRSGRRSPRGLGSTPPPSPPVRPRLPANSHSRARPSPSGPPHGSPTSSAQQQAHCANADQTCAGTSSPTSATKS